MAGKANAVWVVTIDDLCVVFPPPALPGSQSANAVWAAVRCGDNGQHSVLGQIVNQSDAVLFSLEFKLDDRKILSVSVGNLDLLHALNLSR